MLRAWLASLLLCACGASQAGSQAAPIRGFSRGSITAKDLYPRQTSKTLTAQGRAVVIRERVPQACVLLGYATGMAERTSKAETAEATLEHARVDLRNRAGGRQADVVVVDAAETWWNQLAGESTATPLWAAVHGRVFRCQGPRPAAALTPPAQIVGQRTDDERNP